MGRQRVAPLIVVERLVSALVGLELLPQTHGLDSRRHIVDTQDGGASL